MSRAGFLPSTVPLCSYAHVFFSPPTKPSILRSTLYLPSFLLQSNHPKLQPTVFLFFESSSFWINKRPTIRPTHEAWCWCIPISGRRLRKPKLAISLLSSDSKIPPPVPRWTFCWCPCGELIFWGAGTKKPWWGHGLNMKIHDFHEFYQYVYRVSWFHTS